MAVVRLAQSRLTGKSNCASCRSVGALAMSFKSSDTVDGGSIRRLLSKTWGVRTEMRMALARLAVRATGRPHREFAVNSACGHEPGVYSLCSNSATRSIG